MESKLITELSEQCEQEKVEILAEQVTTAVTPDCSSEQDLIQRMEAQIAELEQATSQAADGSSVDGTGTVPPAATSGTDTTAPVFVVPPNPASSLGIRIMIDMDAFGNYTIQEWVDPSLTYDLDGFIFEIFKDPEGHL
jgi:hypothetical protein